MRCEICDHDQFFPREGTLPTTGTTFLGMDWASTSANCVVCARCAYVHWFLPTSKGWPRPSHWI